MNQLDQNFKSERVLLTAAEIMDLHKKIGLMRAEIADLKESKAAMQKGEEQNVTATFLYSKKAIQTHI